jgi:TfoX/Sxy family transcriptional regulator of competence genes
MAFDEGLAERIRELTATYPSISERKMFGGLCFMSSGNMCFGVLGSEIMVRVGTDAYEAALQLPHAREMDFTGRSMRGMVYVDPVGISEDDELEAWLHRGLAYAESLPPKARP